MTAEIIHRLFADGEHRGILALHGGGHSQTLAALGLDHGDDGVLTDLDHRAGAGHPGHDGAAIQQGLLYEGQTVVLF